MKNINLNKITFIFHTIMSQESLRGSRILHIPSTQDLPDPNHNPHRINMLNNDNGMSIIQIENIERQDRNETNENRQGTIRAGSGIGPESGNNHHHDYHEQE